MVIPWDALIALMGRETAWAHSDIAVAAVQTEAVPQGFMAEVGIPRGKILDRPRAAFSPAPDCPPGQDRGLRGASSSGVPISRCQPGNRVPIDATVGTQPADAR